MSLQGDVVLRTEYIQDINSPADRTVPGFTGLNTLVPAPCPPQPRSNQHGSGKEMAGGVDGGRAAQRTTVGINKIEPYSGSRGEVSPTPANN